MGDYIAEAWNNGNIETEFMSGVSKKQAEAKAKELLDEMTQFDTGCQVMTPEEFAEQSGIELSEIRDYF